MKSELATYSFRAECQADIDAFEKQCGEAGLVVNVQRFPDPVFPDVDAEMKAEAPIETLREHLRQVIDGHVMLQTLRACPLNQNSLERDYKLQ